MELSKTPPPACSVCHKFFGPYSRRNLNLGYNFNLQAALKLNQITQRELSRKIKVPEAHISRLINGNMILSRQRLALIAEALDKTVQELFD